MDNYNNMMNQQYGNIVYSNNMMQPNMPMQQNPSLIPDNTQHNIQNDSRMPPSLMEPRGLQMVSENPNLTSDSMRIADNNMDPVQNSYAQSSGNSGYSTNYVANMSTNTNEMHNLNIPQPKLHENSMTDVHTQHLLHDDKYKQDPAGVLEPIMTQQQYEPVVPPETNPPIVEEFPAAPVNEISEDFKLSELKSEIPAEVPQCNIETAEIKVSNDAVAIEAVEINKDESVSSQIENEIVNKQVPEEIETKEPLEEKDVIEPAEESEITELGIPEAEMKENKEEYVEKEIMMETEPEVKPVEEDLNAMCRVCLKTNLTNLIDLCDQDGVLKILEKVMLCASVQIAKNDGLPCHICETCVEKLHVAYEFKTTCESSDVELRKRLNIVVPKTVVKTEFVLIECDDQDYNMDESEYEKPRSRRKYKEDSEDYHVSDSVDDSGSDSSFSLSKSKSKRKSKRRTRSTSKRQLPKRERRSKEWKHEIVTPPEVTSRKRTKYVVDPDDDKPLITIKKIKPDEKTAKHACEICNKTFPYLSFLKQHMLTHQGKDTIIKCKFCTAKFTVQEDYKQHTLDYHAEDLDEDYPIVTPKKYKKSLSKTDSGDEERTPRERKSHKCPYCDVVCTSAMKLKTHKRTHVGEKPFVCHICQKPFKQTVSLEAHIKRHAEDKTLQCEHCQKIFPAKSELNRHVKTEHVEKHFECAVCNKEFPTKVKLDKHVLKHEKEDEEMSVKDCKEKKTPSTKDLFKSIAPITSTYWSDSYSD